MRNVVGLAAIMVCLLAGVRANAGEGDTPRQGRGNFDPAAFRQRMMDRIKEQLAPTDDEWKVLQPKIEAAQKQSMEARMSGFGGGGRRGGTGGGGGNNPAPAATADAPAQPQSDVQVKTAALRTLMENKEADPKAIAEKVKELREAKEKSKVELKKTQDELREIVTPRQEAQLILLQILE
jgi:hypothetical protein